MQNYPISANRKKPTAVMSADTSKVKKMKQGMSYSAKEKTIIMNVFKYFRSQYPEKNVTELVGYTAKATGCSEKSIFSFRKEEASPQGFKEPSRTKVRKKVNVNNRLVKYNESIRVLIRNEIYDLKSRNVSPSLNIILKSLNSNHNVPRFSLMTLRRLLSDMGFYYEKSGSKSVLVEKKENHKPLIVEADKLKSDNPNPQLFGQSQPIHYGPGQENNLISNSVNTPLHMSMILTSRIPAYHLQPYARPDESHLYMNQEPSRRCLPSQLLGASDITILR